MKKVLLYITLTTLVFLLAACSAQKNTGLSRAYHNLTARYNVLFNGSESFNDGLEKLEKEHKDDYSEILPVFNYDDKQAPAIAGSDMDRTIKKCTKLITLHSITAKPKVKDNKTLSPDEREFLNKKEYNVFVDDAYLLMGKSHFYKHEYAQAAEIFRKIIADFKNQTTAFEAQIWLAKVSIATGKLLDASEILSSLTNNASVPEKLMQEFYPTYADLNLKQKDYSSAVTNLEKAIEFEKHKKTRIRYYYILAQLYEKTGELKKASDFYGRVIKMNPVYEMAFNAHINRALSYEEGFGQASQIENELIKMLNDDKNIEYQDQIYYALGNLAVKQGNQKKAVEYYTKSIAANKGNNQQKVRSYLTLADYFYALPDYPNAQAYYDSVVTYIDPDYPGYNVIFTKSKSLTRLVTEINTVTLGDSVLLLADLPRETLNSKIDAIIEAERKREEEARIKQQEKQLDEQFGQEVSMQNPSARQATINTGNKSQWYFYNDAAKNQGFREFKLKWGNRRLEDHWQRASKAVVNFAPADETAETEDAVTPEASYSKMSREFYYSGIPFTDSAKQATIKDIEAALYNMGIIYKEELKDYEKANESFKSLVKRFPSSTFLLASYYNLYGIAREQNNQAMMDYYKGIIARDFPGSTYARVLTDPEYFVKLEQEDQQIKDYYRQTYELYSQGKYADVISRTGYARKTYPSHKLTPQFTYLNILAQGKFTDRKVFRDSLKAVAAKYPNTEIASDAANLISYMDQEHPEIKEAEEIRISQEIYDYSPIAKHLFVFEANKNINANQLVFNIINYNLDKYDSLNLIVEVINLDGKTNLVTVKTFKNQEKAVQYMNAIKGSQEILKDLPDINMVPFVISEKNLLTLKKDKSVDRYLKFYLEKYK
ncbi:MAG TPA: tetratricopeptide repeat protein [Bacteroidales bacterium]|nr:tetratricopeptide repeat protein [Bacteroidales bacterium]